MKVFIDGLEPKKAHKSDAAFDLRAKVDEPLTIAPNTRAFVRCDFTIAIPERYVGLICPRSGLALTHGVTVLNAPGVIDPNYRGEVGVILANFGYNHFEVATGDRIAQLLIVPNTSVTFVQNKNFFGEQTDRGENGFGSTGVA